MHTASKHFWTLISQFLFLSLILAFALGLNYLHAWTAPTQAPTGGNVAAPLNTGGTLQGKSGGLQMSSLDIIGTNGGSLIGGQLSFWDASTIVNPSYTIDMGPLDPSANNGIRFPDDTVQTTAAPASYPSTVSSFTVTNALTAGSVRVGNRQVYSCPVFSAGCASYCVGQLSTASTCTYTISTVGQSGGTCSSGASRACTAVNLFVN